MSTSRLIFDDKCRVGEWVAEQMPDGASWHNYYAMGAETKGNIVSGIVFESMNGHNANVHIAVSKPTKLFLELLDHIKKVLKLRTLKLVKKKLKMILCLFQKMKMLVKKFLMNHNFCLKFK